MIIMNYCPPPLASAGNISPDEGIHLLPSIMAPTKLDADTRIQVLTLLQKCAPIEQIMKGYWLRKTKYLQYLESS